MVEQRTCNAKVISSIPISGTKNLKRIIAVEIKNMPLKVAFLCFICLTAGQNISIIAGSVRRGGRVVKGDGL